MSILIPSLNFPFKFFVPFNSSNHRTIMNAPSLTSKVIFSTSRYHTIRKMGTALPAISSFDLTTPKALGWFLDGTALVFFLPQSPRRIQNMFFIILSFHKNNFVAKTSFFSYHLFCYEPKFHDMSHKGSLGQKREGFLLYPEELTCLFK